MPHNPKTHQFSHREELAEQSESRIVDRVPWIERMRALMRG